MSILNIFRNKENNKENTWTYYQDKLGDAKLSVRVNTIYTDKQYSHTYYLQVNYSPEKTNKLPNGEFLQNLATLEDECLELFTDIFGEDLAYLGNAIFGGSSYMTFASNLNIKWAELIKSYFGESIKTGVYVNDNMGYYNKVLYPKHIRS